MNISLRPFRFDDADYAAAVAIHGAIFPEYSEQVSDWRHWDSLRPEHCLLDRWVAERAGAVVAYAQALQFAWMYHPHKFYLYVDVHPDHQGQGIGGRLYDLLLERLAPREPIALRTDTRVDLAGAVRFVSKRGFVEEMRAWESRLDLAAFDPAPWAGHEQRVLAQGIEIVTMRQLIERGVDFKHDLYEAMVEMGADVPRPDTYTPMPFESWEHGHFGDENLLPEGYFIALHRGAIAGVSQLWRHSGDPTVLNTGLTATRRDFRRMGIALALKLRAIAFAKGQGAREIRTGNDSSNRPMLSINEALGFVKQPAWVTMVNVLREG